MKHNKICLASLLAASVTSLPTLAVDNVKINGFGNVVVGATSSGDTFLGYDDDLNFDNESLFALQVSSDISDKLSATVQLMARGNEDYDGTFEWAYISYEITPSLTAVAGRFRQPLFNYSSSLDVGYSYHWVTAPSTIYNVPFNNMDGVKLSKSGFLGSWDYNFDAALGTFDSEFLGASSKGENVFLISSQFTNDAFTFRGVYGSAKISTDFTSSTNEAIMALGNGINTIASLGFEELADLLRIDDDTATFTGVSASYDNSDYFVGFEYTKTEADEVFANPDESFYVTAGTRIGDWTPALTYEKFESSGDVKYGDQIESLASSGLPNEVVSGLTALAIGSQLSQLSEYSIITASLRYDLTAGMALKADISKRSDDIDSSLDATLARMAVNFVF